MDREIQEDGLEGSTPFLESNKDNAEEGLIENEPQVFHRQSVAQRLTPVVDTLLQIPCLSQLRQEKE